MTDRPRKWTLYEYRDGHVESVRFNLSQPAIRVVEWDRERVVPIIEQPLDHQDDPLARTNRDLAEAVFDALTRRPNET